MIWRDTIVTDFKYIIIFWSERERLLDQHLSPIVGSRRQTSEEYQVAPYYP